MSFKEPKHMKELHKVREDLSKKWNKLSREERIRSINESVKWAKEEMKKLQEKRKVSHS